MATSTTRFEVLLPVVDPSVDNASFTAVQTFISNMTSLVQTGTVKKLFLYQSNEYVSQGNYYTVFGYLTVAQQSTALGYLNTLNSSIAAGYSPVTCVAWNGNLQP